MNSALTAPAQKNWRIWGGITVVFLCGLLVGVTATNAYHSYERQQRWSQGLAGMKPRVLQHLTQELHLSDDQRQRIDIMVSEAERELLSLRLAQQPRIEDVFVQTIGTIKTTLTPDQQRTLDSLYASLKQRWASDRAYADQLQSASHP